MSRSADSKLRNAGEGGSSSAARVGGDAPWRGFINVELTASEKAQFDDWALTGEPWEVLEEVVADGCVVTLKQDRGGPAFLASSTQRRAGSPNAGYCVTARAGTGSKALFRLLFVLVRLGPTREWVERGSVADPDKW